MKSEEALIDLDKVKARLLDLAQLEKVQNQLVQYIKDTHFFHEDGMIDHDCEYNTNPEKGYCFVCDMWSHFMEENE